MTPIKVALAAGLALIAIALAATLAHSPAQTVARSVQPEAKLLSTTSAIHACQRGETLPRDTSAIRLGLFAVSTPEVTVRVLAGSRRIAQGALPVGWSGEGATVPVDELSRAVSPVEVCFAIESVSGRVELLGRATPAAEATLSGSRPLRGRISIEYLQPSHRSWWSLAASVARRLDLGHAVSGAWNALLVIALAGTIIALSSWLLVRELR